MSSGPLTTLPARVEPETERVPETGEPAMAHIVKTEPGESAPAAVASAPALDLNRLRACAAAGPLVLTCRYGVRSAALARLLRAEGSASVFALTQG